MIDLTPLEVRKKKGDFRRVMRGYDPQSVDDFLDLVADRLEQLVRENMAVNERVAASDAHVSEFRERERALTEALVTAQEMREDMRKQMEREADLKRREAEADADVIRAAAVQTREREEETIRRLRVRQSQFVQSYRNFLERELAELAVIAETLDYPIAGEEEPADLPMQRAAVAPEPVVPAAETVVSTPVAPVAAALAHPDTAASPKAPEAEAFSAQRELDIDVTRQADAAPADQTAFNAPPPEELPELELVDEVSNDDDTDGWVSSLLEGKGD